MSETKTARKGSYGQQREALWRKGKRRCHYCDRSLTLVRGLLNSMTLDHRKPLSKGGYDKPENHAACCARCNNAKADLLEHEFRRLLANGTAFRPKGIESQKHKAFMRAVAEIARKRENGQRNQSPPT